MTDLEARRDALLLATLPHVPFEGWTPRALREGAREAGLDPTEPDTLFPGGPAEMVAHFSDFADRRMEEDLLALDPPPQKVAERVREAIRLRLERWSGEREAVRRAASLLAMPQNAPLAGRATFATVDAIWHAAGDDSVDFSWYTKRATLAAVFSTTVLVWLDDDSPDIEETLAFLDRRLADLAQIPKLRGRVEARLSLLPNPMRLLPARGRRGRRFGLTRG
ncbi:MAG: COQ9 family protein [Alphaproteobacteria bacterium]|nr:COQ9 family protein [Alphaproteobacteria bacterium]